MVSALSGCSSIRLSAVRNKLSVLPPSRHEKNVVQSNKKGSAFVIKEVKVICLVVFYLSLNLPALSLTESIACKVGLNIWHQLFYILRFCVLCSELTSPAQCKYSERRVQCKTKNTFFEFALPSRILYYANIAKGECIAKSKKLVLDFCTAESNPILCKYTEIHLICLLSYHVFAFNLNIFLAM